MGNIGRRRTSLAVGEVRYYPCPQRHAFNTVRDLANTGADLPGGSLPRTYRAATAARLLLSDRSVPKIIQPRAQMKPFSDEQLSLAIWAGDQDRLFRYLPCTCCCDEHTAAACPARRWSGCRGQGTLDPIDDAEAWAAYYGMPRWEFFGLDPSTAETTGAVTTGNLPQ